MIRTCRFNSQKFKCIFLWLFVIGVTFSGSILANVHAQQVAVNLNTGNPSYRIPIEVPSGTAGRAPSLALVYGGGQGNGPLGQGWALEGLSYIELVGTQAKRTSSSPGLENVYRLVLNGKSYRLVNTGIDPSGASSSGYWRTERESFLRIFRLSPNGWIITDPDGRQYFFGNEDYAIVGKWGNAWSRMYLTQIKNGVYDPIQYKYAFFPDSSQNKRSDAYIQEIIWAGHKVVFDWESPRPDPFPLGIPMPGPSSINNIDTQVIIDQRLKSIRVESFKVFSSYLPIRRYDFDYIESPSTSLLHTKVSQLEKVSVTGANGTTALPPTVFSYHSADTSPNMTEAEMTGDPVEAIGREAGAVCTKLIDWNKDGWPDLIVGKSESTFPEIVEEIDEYKLYLHDGANGFLAPVQIKAVDNSKLRTLCTYQKVFTYSYSLRRSVVQYSVAHNTMLADLDGDRLPDYLHRPGTRLDPKPGVPWLWRKNLGNNQFGPEQQLVNPPPLDWLEDKDISLSDLNGDGLLDFVWFHQTWTSDSNGTNAFPRTHFFINWWANIGNGKFENPKGSTLVCGLPRQENCEDLTSVSLNWSGGGSVYRLSDLNGDGYTDFAQLIRRPDHTPDGIPGWQYLPGAVDSTNGQFYFRKSKVMLNTTLFQTDYGLYASSYFYLVDVNGDGLPDALRGAEGQVPIYQPNIAGLRFGADIEMTGGLAFSGSKQSITLADMNGDGFADILRGAGGSYKYGTFDHQSNHQKLELITQPLGGKTTLTYSRKTLDSAAKWVVSRLETDSGFTNASMGYVYEKPLTAGWPWNEFRGFKRVTETDPSGATTDFSYYQDDIKTGTLKTVERKNNKGFFTTKIRYFFDEKESPSGVFRFDLSQKVVDTYDGATSPVKTLLTKYKNYDNYGNAKIQQTLGTGIKPRMTTTDYSYNLSKYIVNKPSSTSITVDGIKVSQKWFEYDNQEGGGPPTIGNLTKEISWFSAGDNPVIVYAYDIVRNRIGTIDANNNKCAATGFTNHIKYDPWVIQYSLVETNALCHEINKDYWGIGGVGQTGLSSSSVPGAYGITGKIATLTDLNGLQSGTYWDPLSREIAAVIPPDSAGFPTQRQSFNTTSFPTSTTIQNREGVSGGTLDQTTYFDGFGRTIQTKKEAEVIGQWVTQDTAYDALGRTASVSISYLTNSSTYTAPEVRPGIQYGYDPPVFDGLGSEVLTTNPDGSTRSIKKRHWVEIETNERGFQTIRTYDALNRLIEVKEDPSAGGVTKYTYDGFDAAGNETRRVTDDRGNVTTKVFDTLGRLIIDIDPDLGKRSFEYDAVGNLLRQVDAKGQTIDYTYDPLNRVKTKMFNVPSSPLNLKVTGETAMQIDLAWSPSEDVGGIALYRMERCENEDCSDFSEIVSTATLGLSDLSIVPGSFYRYRVRAVDTDGFAGRYSNIASAVASDSPSDLSIASLTSPSNAFTGSAILNLGATLTNLGDGSAGSTRLGIYLSSDAVITTSDLLLDEFLSKRLLPNESRTERSVLGYYVPSNLAAGIYYIGAIADKNNEVLESNEGNNTAANAVSLVPGPDLKIVQLSGPSIVKTGTGMVTSVTLENGGRGRADSYYVGYYLSDDSTITSSDLFLGSGLVQNHMSGETINGSHSVGLPFDLVEGHYYLGAVVDYSNAVVEGNEGNNTFVSETLIDIQPGDLSWLPAVLYLLLN